MMKFFKLCVSYSNMHHVTCWECYSMF